MNKSSGIAIAVIAAIFLAALAVIIPAAIRVNKEVDRMVEYEDIAAKTIAAYPKIGEIVVDSIYKLEACEGDIAYSVTDKDDIAEVMSILKGLELTPKYIGPEDETTRTEGAPKDALWLYVYMEDVNESWNLIVDDDNMPTDFVIEHYVWKDMGTHLVETKTGYYTKPDKIYSMVKAIMYKGEKIDLNEVSNQELDEP